MAQPPPQAMQQAFAAYNRRAWNEAEALCRGVLGARPDDFDALNLLGIIAAQTRRLEEAAELLGRAVALNSGSAEARNNYGNILQLLGRLDEALDSYDRVLESNPDNAEAHNNRGNALYGLKRLDEALDCYARASTIKPDYAEAHNNRGNVLQELRRLHEALESFDRALRIKPDFAEAHYNRGNALQELKRLVEALDCYGRALTIKPDFAEAHFNRGNALKALARAEAAVDSYDRALKIKPEYAEAYSSRGDALFGLKRLDEALDSYARALKIRPDHEFLYGMRLHTRMLVCDWSDTEHQFAELFQKIERDERVSPPLVVLAMVDSLHLQRKAAAIWVSAKHPASFALPPIPKRARREKIRIGYFSADFRNHAVSLLMAGVFEAHDKSRFECTAFAYGPDARDEMRKRVEAAFDRFIDVRDRPDEDVVKLARDLEIDIAIDLGGATEHNRMGIFARRAAPVQAGYLGYLGTMGAEYIDYLFADPTIIPRESQSQYSEKIVYLPSYQANDSKRRISNKRFTRAELGLPDTGIVFCCYNNNYKITPETFDSWMRILGQVEGSVLFLYADNKWAPANLRKEAVARGVSADRLVFGKRMSPPEYLARYRVADLFLDTLPYNAGTTASDALWAGLPVLTCTGEAFAGRVAASLLTAIHLPELITTSRGQYEALAVELATHPERLRQVRQKLERNRLTTPLFDTQRFTKHIEDAYVQMLERYRSDLPPDHIYVASSVSP